MWVSSAQRWWSTGFYEMAYGMVYSMKRSGHWTEPYGVTQKTKSGMGCKEWLEVLIEKDLEDRYYWNQSRAEPETPNPEEHH